MGGSRLMKMKYNAKGSGFISKCWCWCFCTGGGE